MPPPAPLKSNAVPEAWATLPTSQWPQLVLTNSAKFKGHSALQGASSFLLRASGDRTIAATARHLLGPNGGVTPTISPDRLDSVLDSWVMYPRTKPQDFMTIAAHGIAPPSGKASDWLLLEIKNNSKPLPAAPLTLRPTPVSVGEEVFLVGVPYSETDRMQNVYRAKVTHRAAPDWFRYRLETPVDIRGFSGAPILDKNGWVVGVMTVWFEPQMDGDKFLEAGGQDAASVAEVVSKKK
ncbi:S1 family peptidase [Luteolibacter soli]|uniref:Serine protease n=1 Tax=Luteolibacter soli TaxID=3135280 RepID=A0ABU9B0Z6_9BACT